MCEVAVLYCGWFCTSESPVTCTEIWACSGYDSQPLAEDDRFNQCLPNHHCCGPFQGFESATLSSVERRASNRATVVGRVAAEGTNMIGRLTSRDYDKPNVLERYSCILGDVYYRKNNTSSKLLTKHERGRRLHAVQSTADWLEPNSDSN